MDDHSLRTRSSLQTTSKSHSLESKPILLPYATPNSIFNSFPGVNRKKKMLNQQTNQINKTTTTTTIRRKHYRKQAKRNKNQNKQTKKALKVYVIRMLWWWWCILVRVYRSRFLPLILKKIPTASLWHHYDVRP